VTIKGQRLHKVVNNTTDWFYRRMDNGEKVQIVDILARSPMSRSTLQVRLMLYALQFTQSKTKGRQI